MPTTDHTDENVALLSCLSTGCIRLCAKVVHSGLWFDWVRCGTFLFLWRGIHTTVKKKKKKKKKNKKKNKNKKNKNKNKNKKNKKKNTYLMI